MSWIVEVTGIAEVRVLGEHGLVSVAHVDHDSIEIDSMPFSVVSDGPVEVQIHEVDR